MEDKLEQPEKILSSIEVREAGSVIEVKQEQSENAFRPIELREEGRAIECKLEHPAPQSPLLYTLSNTHYDDENVLNDTYFKEFVQKKGAKFINRLCFLSALYDELSVNYHA